MTETYTVNVTYEETRQATRNICKPVTKNVSETYTVNVPYEETRQATAHGLQAGDRERIGDLHGLCSDRCSDRARGRLQARAEGNHRDLFGADAGDGNEAGQSATFVTWFPSP